MGVGGSDQNLIMIILVMQVDKFGSSEEKIVVLKSWWLVLKLSGCTMTLRGEGDNGRRKHCE